MNIIEAENKDDIGFVVYMYPLIYERKRVGTRFRLNTSSYNLMYILDVPSEYFDVMFGELEKLTKQIYTHLPIKGKLNLDKKEILFGNDEYVREIDSLSLARHYLSKVSSRLAALKQIKQNFEQLVLSDLIPSLKYAGIKVYMDDDSANLNYNNLSVSFRWLGGYGSWHSEDDDLHDAIQLDDKTWIGIKDAVRMIRDKYSIDLGVEVGEKAWVYFVFK